MNNFQKQIAALIFSAFTVCSMPVFADDSLSPKIIYAPAQTVSNEIQCILNSNLPTGYTGVLFNPYIQNGDKFGHGVGDNNPLHWILQTDKTLLYWTPPTPPVVPDVAGFENAVFNDPTIPVVTIVNLVPFRSTVEQYAVTSPTTLQSIWAGMVSVYGVAPGWLSGDCTDGTPIIQKIQDYAVQYHIALQP